MIELTHIDAARLRTLELLLHAEIPLSQAMQVRVLRFDRNGLVLGAALAPNLNHKKTAFGGSLNSLATLACWGLVQLLRPEEPKTAMAVVIQWRRISRRFVHYPPRPSWKNFSICWNARAGRGWS